MNCIIPKAKVYSVGSHFIAVLPGYYKRKKKGKNKDYTIEVEGKRVDLKEKYTEVRKENSDKSKKDRNTTLVKEMAPLVGGIEEAEKIVEELNIKYNRNFSVRMVRLFRCARILYPTHFVTFTYDDKKHTPESFRKSLSQTLYNFSSRHGWKYIGVWEEGVENGRLHFHAIIRIPEGKMIGELFEKRDYDVINHKMQTTTQNTYFLERFGRTDFVEINTFVLSDTIKYLVKYLSKTNEYAVFSRGIKPFIEADILVEDILCYLDEENPGKVILADDFLCIQDGEVLGRACPEIIDKMRKTN